MTPEDWTPQGIGNLEPAAWEALRNPGCTCVLAGPGAGKTEFLAQRAAYLLQTGICRAPSHVLAISFKKDAAENLAKRVKKRCEPNHAARFHSMTFDSFTKGLVDRFLNTIPISFRPTPLYDIILPNKRSIEEFLTTVRLNAPAAWQREIAGIQPSTFETNVIGSHRLPHEFVTPKSGLELAVQQWWLGALLKRPKSELSFTMLNRLAELILRTNPQIRRALHLTYPFVFIDEFQDTTYGQYDFLLSVFKGTNTAVTAVGDNKQRIMGWAGALPNAFQQFESDFEAREISLQFNFRSTPDLVRIQQVIAQAIDEAATEAEAQVSQVVAGEAAEVWTFQTNAAEADHIAQWLVDDMRNRGNRARDYALLVRQTADVFESQLTGALEARGLKMRNESKIIGRIALQDLLVERLVKIGIAILRLAAEARAPEAWSVVSEAMQRLRAVDPEDEVECQKVERSTSDFLEELRSFMSENAPSVDSVVILLPRVLKFLDLGSLRRAFMEYNVGESLAIAIEGFQRHLNHSAQITSTWKDCLDTFEGNECLPLMTVHKSKGLEYDTILFIGLDDNTWWSHVPGNTEGLATFFVALSRAKQHVIFTFSSERGGRSKVAEMYQLLNSASVAETGYP